MEDKKNLAGRIKGLMTGSSLASRIAKGGVWLAMGSSVEQVMRLVRNMILTRLLLPEAFGTMSILLAVNIFFESLSQVGLKEAIIQDEHGRERQYLNGAWLFAVCRGVLLYMIGFIAAPYLANFYDNPQLTQLLRLIFLSLFFRGTISVGAYVAVKNLNFKKWTAIEQTGGIIGILTAIGLSFVYRSVYVLVIGYVVEWGTKMILSYIICPFRPRWDFNRKYLKSLFKFTRGMLGIPIFTFIFMRADVFFLGKMLDQASLGVYSIALSLAQLPSLFFQKFITPLFMPAFSELRGDKDRINAALLTLSRVFGFFGFPLIGFIVFFGDGLLSLLFTSTYAAGATVLALLFTSYSFMSINSAIVSVYLSHSQPNLLRVFTVLRALMLAGILYPAILWQGANGAAAAVLTSMLTAFVLQTFFLQRLTGLKPHRLWGRLLQSAPYVLPLVFGGLLRTMTKLENPVSNLLIGIPFLLASYGLGIRKIISEARKNNEERRIQQNATEQ